MIEKRRSRINCKPLYLRKNELFKLPLEFSSFLFHIPNEFTLILHTKSVTSSLETPSKVCFGVTNNINYCLEQ